MKAKTFDRKFDSGGKIVDQLDIGKARRVGTDARRVNVDFPAWMVDSLDREARRLGGDAPVADQALAGRQAGTAGRYRKKMSTVTTGGECREWRPPPVVHDSCQPP
jgi:hypothetical protein